MSVHQKVVPLSPNYSSSSNGPEVIVLSGFTLKPAGTGATRNTLVENDSLSSYSWPEETPRRNGVDEQSGKRFCNARKKLISSFLAISVVNAEFRLALIQIIKVR